MPDSGADFRQMENFFGFLALAVALVFSQGPQLAQRIVNAFIIMLCLVFVNGFIAFAGCFFTGAPNPTPQELTPANFGRGGGNDAANGQTLPESQLPAAR